MTAEKRAGLALKPLGAGFKTKFYHLPKSHDPKLYYVCNVEEKNSTYPHRL